MGDAPEVVCEIIHVHFSGERVHHFHQIIKGIYDRRKGLQVLRGIPVIHFIAGLGNGGRKLKMASKKGGAKLLIFSPYSK